MTMLNLNKLKGKIYEQGYNVSTLADAMQISRQALYKRLSGRADLRISEIEQLCDVLNITRDELTAYFFA